MKNDSSSKYSYQGYFFMCKDTFSCLKNKQKKGYMEMVEKFYLETLMSVLGSSIYHYLHIYIERECAFVLKFKYVHI